MDNVEVVTTATYLFFVYLLLAILVERTLEMLVAVYNYLELKFKWYEFWNTRAKTLQARFDRVYGFQGEKMEKTEKLFSWLLWKVISEKPYEGGKEVVSADLVRINYIRVGCRTLGFLLAVGLVVALKLDLVEIVNNAIPQAKVLSAVTNIKIVRLILTAAAISVGTEPLHQFITHLESIEKRRKSGGARIQGG